MENAPPPEPAVAVSEEHVNIHEATQREVKGYQRLLRRLAHSKPQRNTSTAEEFELDDYSAVLDFDTNDPLFDTTDDHFQAEVVRKTQKYSIGKAEAEVRVMIDRIVESKGGEGEALLFVLSQDSLAERKVSIFTSILLHRGANPSVCDGDMRTPLHHAVRRNLLDVTRRLLENDALPNAVDKKNVRPLTLAIKNCNDRISSLLIDNMSNNEARDLFLATENKPAQFRCKTLLDNNMENSVLSLLDCMKDQYGSSRQAKVYYSLLESDSRGRTPSHSDFHKDSKSILYHIAKSGNKNIIYHDVVRLLLRKKWKEDMRIRFVLSSILYLFTLFALIYSAVVASSLKDPTVYDTALQLSRAVFEVFACVSVAVTFVLEINQFRRHRLRYWMDLFNLLDITSSVLLLTVIPLRFTHNQAQWHVFSIGFLLWSIRIFKYSSVFRQTGAYAQILWRILSYDIVQFMLFFVIILVAFSASFLLALKGENSLDTYRQLSNFWWILFSGLRTLIETEPIEENYTDLPPLSVILLVLFMFLCIVVMLNLLIAQLADTYQNIQSDAQRGLELTRAWIITRMEINSLFMGNQRIKRYKEMEVFEDFQDVLSKWDLPPLNTIHTKLKQIEDTLDTVQGNNDLLLQRLVWQERALIDIQNRLPPATNQTGLSTTDDDL